MCAFCLRLPNDSKSADGSAQGADSGPLGLSRLGRGLEEFSEIIERESCIAGDSTHRESVDRVVARNCDDARAISHDDMLALPGDPKSCLLERTDGIEVVDSRNPWHG